MLVLIVLFILAALIALYIAALINTGYWKRRGISGPKPRPFDGNLNEYWGNTNVFHLREWTKQFGKVYGIQEGWTNIMVVSDIEMLHELFTKKFEYFHARKTSPLMGNVDKEPRIHVFNARGARWKRLRAIANPVFSTNNIKKIMPVMDDSTRVTLDFLDKAYEKGQPFNIHPYFHELTMDVISRIAMGQKGTRQFCSENVKLAERVLSGFGKSHFIYLSWTLPKLAFFIRKFAMWSSVFRDVPFQTFIKTIDVEVRRRKKIRETGEIASNDEIDFIDLFLDAESSEVTTEDHQNKAFDKSSSKISKRLTTDEIVAQCFVFLLAGFDTTANALACTCYYLAKNPLMQERLQQEIDDICPEGPPTYEQLNKLKYAEAAMKETLRMHPIAAFACGRLCAETTTLGDYTVEAGTVVQADVLSTHYDKTIWGENADEFHPERWLEESEHRHPQSWFPFGSGPRTCIGMKLAYLEEKQALVYILRKYNIVSCAETEKELKMVGAAVLNPESVTVKLELRKDI